MQGRAPEAALARSYAPLAVAAAALGGCVVLAVADPQDGGYPLCPFYALTGLHCPGCGSLRALGRLVRLDVAGALALNVLLVVALPYLAYRYLEWAGRSLRLWSLPGGDLPPRAAKAVLGIVVAFTLLRNLPAFAFLAPT
jgi:hypothetical protein